MSNQTDRIQNAINHIKTATDVDPWAMEIAVEAMEKELKNLSQKVKNSSVPDTNVGDMISRQAAITAIQKAYADTEGGEDKCAVWKNVGLTDALHIIQDLPSAQPEKTQLSEEDATSDFISRQAAIDAADRADYTGLAVEDVKKVTDEVVKELKQLPSVQPEQRCVNCGRTVNNGGWYKDGRTRCPIEEHYALPKDGYCHLWEKRKVWEDDYVKRLEEGEK